MPPHRRSGSQRPDRLLAETVEPVFIWGPGTRLIYVNAAWERLTGRTLAEVAGIQGRSHGPTGAEDLASVAACFDPPVEAWRGQSVSSRGLLVRAGGDRVELWLQFTPFRGDEGGVEFILGRASTDAEVPSVPLAHSQRLRVELQAVREDVLRRLGSELLIGRGPRHQRLVSQVELARERPTPILIVGAVGAGKRHLSRLVHGEPVEGYRLLDCGALPAEVLRRELLTRLTEAADRTTGPGSARIRTMTLQDVFSIPRDVQADLVRAVGTRDLIPGVRLIGLASTEPEAAVRDGRLREDLYWMLSALRLELPPLVERRDELAMFAQHFVERVNRAGSKQRRGVEAGALDLLLAYDWPGNLSELERVIQAAHDRSEGPTIRSEDIPAAIQGELGGAHVVPPRREELPLDETLVRVETELIRRAMERAGGNKSRAAGFLQVSRARLHRRLVELGLEAKDAGGASEAGDGDESVETGPRDRPGG